MRLKFTRFVVGCTPLTWPGKGPNVRAMRVFGERCEETRIDVAVVVPATGCRPSTTLFLKLGKRYSNNTIQLRVSSDQGRGWSYPHELTGEGWVYCELPLPYFCLEFTVGGTEGGTFKEHAVFVDSDGGKLLTLDSLFGQAEDEAVTIEKPDFDKARRV